MKFRWLVGTAMLVAACASSDVEPADSGASSSSGGTSSSGDGGANPGDAGTDARPPPSDLAKQLLAALGTSTWNGTAKRRGKMRQVELRFRSDTLQWAETQNPYGPSRRRELRAFAVDEDGLSVDAVANTPLTWPDRTDVSGPAKFQIKVIAGTPRKLQVIRDGVTEIYSEGPVPKPTSGLTARVRVFPSGDVSDAFCTSGISAFDYTAFLNFARGKGNTKPIAEDMVAGAKLLAWVDASGQNRFSVTDLDGMLSNGGTEMTDTFNFFVQYTGTITHPGGQFRMRERDDVVEDGLWAFLGQNVGSLNVNNLFLEVHSFATPDKTPDEPSINLAAGKIPVEIIVARCAQQIKPVHIEVAFGAGAYQLVGNAPSTPAIDDTLFPPAL